MSSHDHKKNVHLLNNLIELLSDSSTQSIEDVHKELLDLGIDGRDFTSKVKAQIKESFEKQRVSWIEKARLEMAQTSNYPVNSKSINKDRPSLLGKLKGIIDRITDSGFEMPQAYFHKFDSATDEDIISMIEDLEQIERLAKKKE